MRITLGFIQMVCVVNDNNCLLYTSVPAWEASLARTEKEINVSKDKQATRRWWNDFWKRSFIEVEGEAGDAIRNYTPVSYTHLDVYKRQILNWMVNFINMILRNVRCFIRKATSSDMKPVSYTHLDVYKRQKQDCISQAVTC